RHGGGGRTALESLGKAGGPVGHLGAQRSRVVQAERDVEFARLRRELHLLEVLRDRVVLGRIDAGMMRGGRRRRERHQSHRAGDARRDHRRAMRMAVNAANQSSATIVAPPNGIHTSHSAMTLLLSTPYAGMSALQVK